MRQALAAVREFHKKHGFPIGAKFPSDREDPLLAACAMNLEKWAKKLEPGIQGCNPDNDLAKTRIHLLTEELAELCKALAYGNETLALDGLTDLLYVLVGFAVSYDLPLAEAFEEVQRSNMSKQRRSDDPGRMRDKGPNYSPPDLVQVMSKHRKTRELEKTFGTGES